MTTPQTPANNGSTGRYALVGSRGAKPFGLAGVNVNGGRCYNNRPCV
jgi:hypothetical protein